MYENFTLKESDIARWYNHQRFKVNNFTNYGFQVDDSLRINIGTISLGGKSGFCVGFNFKF